MQEEAAFIKAISQVSGSFLGSNTTRFAQEMYKFISSGLQLQSYDLRTGEAQAASLQMASEELPGLPNQTRMTARLSCKLS